MLPHGDSTPTCTHLHVLHKDKSFFIIMVIQFFLLHKWCRVGTVETHFLCLLQSVSLCTVEVQC